MNTLISGPAKLARFYTQGKQFASHQQPMPYMINLKAVTGSSSQSGVASSAFELLDRVENDLNLAAAAAAGAATAATTTTTAATTKYPFLVMPTPSLITNTK